MTDRRSREKSLRELEFIDLNIHLYLTLNYGMASEHLDFDFMVLYNAFVLSWGLTITQNSIHTISDLDRSRLTDTRSAENDRIGADTDPEYRIDASLSVTCCCLTLKYLNYDYFHCNWLIINYLQNIHQLSCHFTVLNNAFLCTKLKFARGHRWCTSA